MSRAPTEKMLERILHEVAAETHVPGIAAAVVFHGVESSAYFGKAAADSRTRLSQTSRFEVSCLMKLFVSLTAIVLAREGVLGLDTSVADVLPELSTRDGAKGRITLGHLLSHSSGYHGLDITDMRVRWGYSWRQFAAHFTQTDQLFEPGAVFNYEHTEHVVVGEMLRRLTEHSAAQLVLDRILGPLGITPVSTSESKAAVATFVANHGYSPRTGHYEPIHVPPLAFFWESSLPDWTMTVAEIARIGVSLLDERRNQLGTADASTLVLLARPFITLPCHARSDTLAEVLPKSFGAGCAHYGGGVLGHNGSGAGQTCALRIDPDDDLVVAVGVNAWSPRTRDTIVRRVVGLCRTGEDSQDRMENSGLSYALNEITNGFALDEVAGRYVGSFLGEAVVRRKDRELICEVGSANRRQSFRIVPENGERYAVKSDMPVSVAFISTPGQTLPVLSLGMHAYKRAP